MVGEAIAGLSAFKTMFDIAKSMKDMDDTVRRNKAVFDLGEQIIATQTRYAAAIEEVDALKKELTRFETWEVEKQRYELKQLYRGPFAYILKEAQQGTEAPHALCTNCFDHRLKSVLQSSGHANAHDHFWFCPACKMNAKSQWRDMGELITKSRENDAKKGAAPSIAVKAKPPGERCPKCGESEFRLDRSEPHPIFGELGGRTHHMKCDLCGFTDERLVTPK